MRAKSESHEAGGARDHDAFSSEAVSRDASAWVARRDRGLSSAEAAEFARWRAADPRHAAEFERLQASWTKMDSARAAPELAQMADAILAQARMRKMNHRLRRWAGLTVAAAAAIACLFVGWQQFGQRGGSVASRLPKENYRVIASTLQRMLLPDGSVAELNGDSRIEVDYSPTERRVRLVSGEAHFVVAKNPERPFYVTAGLVTVRAVGTAFNVRLASEKIEVLVTEGRVKLEHDEAGAAEPATAASAPAPSLVEGQKAIIRRETAAKPPAVSVDEVNRAEIEQELGWQSTRLVFNNTPLDEVIKGFNRYNQRRLTLGDPELKNRALTGVFRADNLEGFVRLLRASVDVKAEERTPHETVLLPIR